MTFHKPAAGVAALLFCTAIPATADTGVFEEVIRVTAVRESADTTVSVPEHPGALAPDAAALVGRMAGAAVINNGPLSGQVQYRGAFGDRVAISVNGQRFHSGGPNMMDPPLSYAPSVLMERIDVSRGAPGADVFSSLMGGLDVKLKSIGYGASEEWTPGYNLSLSGREIDSSYGVGGVVGASNNRYRVFAMFSDESGDDSEWSGGSIDGTSFDRELAGVTFGYREGARFVDVEVRRQSTGPTGNPPFAMDIEYIDTDFARIAFGGDVASWSLTGAVGYTDVAHGMNNYAMRPALSSPMRFRRTLTEAQTVFGSLRGEHALGDGSIEIGVDTEQADKAALITNPNNAAFFVGTLSDIDVERSGLWLSWRGRIGELDMALGGRVDRHSARAGQAFAGPALPDGPRMLAMAFNGQDRDWSDTTGDASARVWWQAGDLTWRTSLSRKTRAPGYVERFAWLPTPASGGLADGNTWIGDVDLDVEVASTFDFGFDYESERVTVRPTIFYSRVDDFVQGLPVDATPDQVDSMVEMVSMMNGDPSPLRFSNVDARLYGVELDFQYRLTPRLFADGVWTHVRGDRLDVDEPLYRMTPSRLMLGLNWAAADYGLRVEATHEAAQDRVSGMNGEATTPSNTVFNLHGTWRVSRALDVAIGVQNLFDRNYSRHLAGYNRHSDSDVPLGARLPGEGRALYLRVNLRAGG